MEFQANAVYKVNGFVIVMKADALQQLIRITTKHIQSNTLIDEQSFNYLEPSDVAAAFAKFSMAVTFAVSNDMNEQLTSGM